MGWHPGSGIGVVALANARYAALLGPVRQALEVLVASSSRTRRVQPWPQAIDARAAVERLLARWDEDLARDLFAMNVELDEPLARRRAEFDRLRLAHGSLRPDPATQPEAKSAAHLRWWMRGERGRVRLEILLSPERRPRVQKLTVASIPEPHAALREIAEVLVGLLGQPCPAWPRGVALMAPADRPAIERGLRAAEVLFGPITLGPPIAGDGVTTATWQLTGERGALDLLLELDAPGGSVAKVAFVPRTMSPPSEAV
jgi:hypothetical protein